MSIDPELGKAIDYVSGWYFKAARLIEGTDIHCAFVSTNSITQGEQVCNVWKPLMERYGIQIDFAYQTFKWESEAVDMAAVHCVIIGFSNSQFNEQNKKPKLIFNDEGIASTALNINPYLIDAPTVYVLPRSTPLCNAPEMFAGGKPTENGNLILTVEEKEALLEKEPQAEKFIRPFMMGKDFIDRKPRYCLWLLNANPSEVKKCPQVMQRIENVRNFRLASKKAATRKKADTPMLFDEIRFSDTDYVAIPKVSSENRRYIPIDYLSERIIPGDKLFVIKNASIYHFGVIVSSVHMAWMRTVCGRLKSDYSYSNTIVYNNFPWCTPTEEQKSKIEETAQAILDARAASPGCSLADLYDETAMTPQLRKAHQNNDRAVMKAYGFPPSLSEMDVVARLMEMYQRLVSSEK